MRSFEHGYLLETAISHSLAMTLRGLGEFRGRQVLHSEQSPEILETLRRVAMIQSVESSNRIEGITVPAARLPGLVADKTTPRDRPEQEVAGYREVLADIHLHHSSSRLSAKLILQWHRTMYRYTGEKRGQWKTKDNAIVEVGPNGRQVIRFRPASALATPEFMKHLVNLFDQSLAEGRTDPLLLIASFILDFECIHPFMDGNGRIGRLLTLLLLYQAGYEVGRYISLERIVEESKETYYEALRRSSAGWHQARHDLRPWWEYFLGMLTAAYNEFEARVGTIASARGVRREMVRRAIDRLPDPFTIADLRRACTGISSRTLKRALTEAVKSRKIKRVGAGPGTRWIHL